MCVCVCVLQPASTDSSRLYLTVSAANRAAIVAVCSKLRAHRAAFVLLNGAFGSDSKEATRERPYRCAVPQDEGDLVH